MALMQCVRFDQQYAYSRLCMYSLISSMRDCQEINGAKYWHVCVFQVDWNVEKLSNLISFHVVINHLISLACYIYFYHTIYNS